MEELEGHLVKSEITLVVHFNDIINGVSMCSLVELENTHNQMYYKYYYTTTTSLMQKCV